MSRKPIQVAVSAAISPSDDTLETIVVLCDDGTLWRDDVMLKDGYQHPCWTRLPDIPQEDD